MFRFRWLIRVSCTVATATAALSEPAPPPLAFADYLVAPLRLHLLISETQPELHTSLTDADLHRIIVKINRVWAQAGIAFTIESIVHEPPAAVPAEEEAPIGSAPWLRSHIPPESYGAGLFNLYYIKQFDANGIYLGKAIFVKDTARLRPVEGGIDEPLPRVSSHELGHALGLPHRQDTFNLMASGTTGTSLNAEEVETARSHARASGRFLRGPDLLAQADSLLQKGETRAAHDIYQILSDLPLEADELVRIRSWLAAQPGENDAATTK